MTYLTPDRFRTLGLGVDLSEIEDVELRSVLESASAAVDAYCAVPKLPQKHDFRGGTSTGEKHAWSLGNDLVPGSRRFYPWHQPVKEISQFRIIVTNNDYVEIGPSDLFINNSEGYVEIVSLQLTQVGIFSTMVPWIGLWRPVASINYTYGFEFPIEGEVLDIVDGRTFQAQHQFWTGTPVIYVNGSEADTADYTVDATEGEVVFDEDAVPDVDDVVVADYTYTLPQEIRDATALIAANRLSERELVAKGMGRLASLRVEEVDLRRTYFNSPRGGAATAGLVVPPEAELLLAGFTHMTVR